MKLCYLFRILLLSSTLTAYAFIAPAQITVQWDNEFEGPGNEKLQDVIATPDGGYLLAGPSHWIPGLIDYQVIKVDANGSKEWDKTFGGDLDDALAGVATIPDGGYLLAGTSSSPASGDKSQGRINQNCMGDRCPGDFWILKIDQKGNKVWDQTIGGMEHDDLSAILPTADGGYMLLGQSRSGVSADKSQPSKGKTDYWIVKIDEEGNKLWDKSFGGEKEDFLTDALATADGGYLLYGVSDSPASGDKSESLSNSDYWLVKLDASGDKLWDQAIAKPDYSSSELSVINTPDQGYLLAGPWLLKTDVEGNQQWKKQISADAVTISSDGGYLLAQIVMWFDDIGEDIYSPRIVKVNENGERQWEQVFYAYFGFATEMITAPDGSILVAGSTYDWEGDWEAGDFWAIAFSEHSDFSFQLIDAVRDIAIQEIRDGTIIDLARLSSDLLSIKAVTGDQVAGSVSFQLNGPFIHRHTENYAPYAIFGDNPSGDFSGRLLPPGEYTLTATPYAEKGKTGNAGTSRQIRFTIINRETIGGQITDFTLFDAVTDQKLMDLTDGSVIHLDELVHEELTVLMHTMPDFVGSVKVELEGPVSLTRIENTRPYTLFRNNSKDLFGQAFPAGAYHLKATPYTEANAQGEAGVPLEIGFMVVGVVDTHARFTAYPVPTSGIVNISYQDSAEQTQMMLLDFTGNILLSLPLQRQAQLDLSSYQKGIYYLKVVDSEGVHLKRVVVE